MLLSCAFTVAAHYDLYNIASLATMSWYDLKCMNTKWTYLGLFVLCLLLFVCERVFLMVWLHNTCACKMTYLYFPWLKIVNHMQHKLQHYKMVKRFEYMLEVWRRRENGLIKKLWQHIWEENWWGLRWGLLLVLACLNKVYGCINMDIFSEKEVELF